MNGKVTNIRKIINSVIQKSSKKISIFKSAIKDSENKDKFKLYGDLISSNIYMLKGGEDHIIAQNYFSKELEEIKIPLNPKINASQNIEYYYKKLNSKTVNKVFKKFRLAYINGYEDDLVDFLVTPSMIRFYLWGNYTYGFYYTADNQPMMTFKGIECDADIEIEDILYGGRYWYRTEKIDDHWYFYQAKVKFYK